MGIYKYNREFLREMLQIIMHIGIHIYNWEVICKDHCIWEKTYMKVNMGICIHVLIGEIGKPCTKHADIFTNIFCYSHMHMVEEN